MLNIVHEKKERSGLVVRASGWVVSQIGAEEREENRGPHAHSQHSAVPDTPFVMLNIVPVQ
jgi:hypothetical protein